MNAVNMFLVSITLIFLGKLNVSVAQNPMEQKSVSPKKANRNNNKNVLWVDLRTSQEFAEKTFEVKNIVNIPIDSLEDHLDMVPKNQKIMLVCRTGNKSKKAFDILYSKDYSKIYHLEGGIVQWEKDGFKTKVPKTKPCCQEPSSCNKQAIN